MYEMGGAAGTIGGDGRRMTEEIISHDLDAFISDCAPARALIVGAYSKMILTEYFLDARCKTTCNR
jgi:hypothetical protein